MAPLGQSGLVASIHLEAVIAATFYVSCELIVHVLVAHDDSVAKCTE
jgi:hypothetical protein